MLSARLNDGAFLYEQGLKFRLEQYNEKLKHVTFQSSSVASMIKLDELYLTRNPTKNTRHRHLTKAQRAALLCKADFATEMVYEFPELQGTIGKYYAQPQEKIPKWLPRSKNTGCHAVKMHLCPKQPRRLVSLADKIDNLIGCFCADLKPTSSSDPYALRRQALGIIKILIRGKYRLPLREVLQECFQVFHSTHQDALLKEIEAFLTNRVKTVFLDYGFTKDEIEAGLAYGFSDIYDAFCRVDALHKFRAQGDKFQPLYEVFKRAKGQVDSKVSEVRFSRQLLSENAETEPTAPSMRPKTPSPCHPIPRLRQGLRPHRPPSAPPRHPLRQGQDPRRRRTDLHVNRLALLQRVFGLFGQLLDFNKIQA